MFCPKCGRELPDGVIFCPNCGFQLSTAFRDQAQPYTPPYTPPTPPAPPKSSSGEYQGGSYMEAFRVISGILFLTGLIGTILNPVIQNVYYTSIHADYSVGTSWLQLLLNMFQYCLIPGIFSLVLRKPKKTNNIILTIVFAAILGYWFVWTIVQTIIYIIHKVLPLGTQLLNLVLSFPLSTIICFLMALISLRQPEFWVGEPKPVRAPKFKRVSGIIHLVGAGLLMTTSFVFLILFLVRHTTYMFGSMGITFLSYSIWLFFAGFCSIRAGAGKRASDCSASYVLLVFVYNIFCAMLLMFRTIFSTGSPTSREILSIVLTALLFSLILAWFIICLVVFFRTFLRGKKETA